MLMLSNANSIDSIGSICSIGSTDSIDFIDFNDSVDSIESNESTGCVKSTGTTFEASTEPHNGLTKNFFYAKRKIFDKSLHCHKIYFLRNCF